MSTIDKLMPTEALSLDKLHAALVKSEPVQAVIDAIRALPVRTKPSDYEDILNALTVHLLDVSDEISGIESRFMTEAAKEVENAMVWFSASRDC